MQQTGRDATALFPGVPASAPRQPVSSLKSTRASVTSSYSPHPFKAFLLLPQELLNTLSSPPLHPHLSTPLEPQSRWTGR